MTVQVSCEGRGAIRRQSVLDSGGQSMGCMADQLFDRRQRTQHEVKRRAEAVISCVNEPAQRLNVEEAAATGDQVWRRRRGSRRMRGMPALGIGPQAVLQTRAVIPPGLGDLAVKVCKQVLVAGDEPSI